MRRHSPRANRRTRRRRWRPQAFRENRPTTRRSRALHAAARWSARRRAQGRSCGIRDRMRRCAGCRRDSRAVIPCAPYTPSSSPRRRGPIPAACREHAIVGRCPNEAAVDGPRLRGDDSCGCCGTVHHDLPLPVAQLEPLNLPRRRFRQDCRPHRSSADISTARSSA